MLKLMMFKHKNKKSIEIIQSYLESYSAEELARKWKSELQEMANSRESSFRQERGANSGYDAATEVAMDLYVDSVYYSSENSVLLEKALGIELPYIN